MCKTTKVIELYLPTVHRMTLISKPGRTTGSPPAFQPICMLDSIGKLFEKILSQRLRVHLEETDTLSNNQFGFRHGRSTMDALGRVLETVRRAKGRTSAKNRYVGMLALDVKNAFNSAP